ncbi:MAG: hypothetical protein ACT4O9_15845 [Blastocatellia bacterium]
MNRLQRASFVIFLAILLLTASAFSQSATKPESVKAEPNPVRASPAYAEILLKKTDVQSDLEAILIDYTDEYPKVTELKYLSVALQRELDRLLAIKPADAGKLTLALGKMIVRRVELEADLWNLQRNFMDEHPDVKRAKKKVAIYDAAIREILG